MLVDIVAKWFRSMRHPVAVWGHVSSSWLRSYVYLFLVATV